MPNVHFSLPETQQSIFRPIVIDIVKQVQEITKMKDSIIYFPEDGKLQTSSGTIDSKENRYVSTTSKRMNHIEVEEEVDTGEISPTFFNGREYRPIFEDRKVGLTVSPVYAKHNVTVTFHYSCGSKTEALRWLQDMRMKLSRLRDINVHSVKYHYNLNQQAYDLVKKVHELRESQAGYNETLDQYIKTHANSRLTIVSDLIGKDQIFAIAETQTEIYGIFDFDALPSKPEKDNDSGMWVIAFGYHFNYDKPIGCHVKYPIVVHNKLMPYELVSFTSDEVRPVAQTVIDQSKTQSAFELFRADRLMDRVKAEDGVILIPPFDDFSPEVMMKYTAGVVQGLAVINEENKRDLINLQDLGDVVLDPDILKFLKESEYSYLSQPYKSFFHVDLYQNNVLQNYDRIEVDSNLNIRAKYDLNIRNQYRVRLSVVTDLDFVTSQAFERIRQYPKVIYKLVAAVNRAFRENPEMNDLLFTKYVSPILFNAIYRFILGKGKINHYDQIGWSLNGILKQNGITDEIMQKIRYEWTRPMRTMIYGTLAFHKDDPNLLDAEAGNLNIPLQTEISS